MATITILNASHKNVYPIPQYAPHSPISDPKSTLSPSLKYHLNFLPNGPRKVDLELELSNRAVAQYCAIAAILTRVRFKFLTEITRRYAVPFVSKHSRIRTRYESFQSNHRHKSFQNIRT